MIWPFKNKRAEDKSKDHVNGGALSEAKRARRESETDLLRIRARRSEVERIADDLRETATQERLTAIFEKTIRRGPEPEK
jgi:hypothetical protein